MSVEFIDGAHEGLTAHQGMALAIGGGDEPKAERTPADMEAYLLAPDSPMPEDGEGYNESARRVGRFILTSLKAHAELRDAPAETVYDWSDFHGEGMPRAVRPGLSDLLKELNPVGYHEVVDGITGFQWGWACNAARYALDLPRVSNPAIVEVQV